MLSLEDGPVVEWVELASAGAEPRVAVDALHEGDLFGGPGPLAARPEVRSWCFERRAEGTAEVARLLAGSLEQDGFLLGRRARGVLDLDAPAGVDLRGHSRALGVPLSKLLTPELRRRMVADHRGALVTMAEARATAQIAVSIQVAEGDALVIRSEVEPDPEQLDPLVPDAVLARSADPFLVGALHAALEERVAVESSPEPLPASSLLARALGFEWLRFLQGEMPARAAPHAPEARRLWAALLDTSGLAADTAAVRGFLLGGLEAPTEERALFERMARLRRELEDWSGSRCQELLRSWFRQPELRHLLVVEVPAEASSSMRREVAYRLAGGIRAWWSERSGESIAGSSGPRGDPTAPS